MSETKKRKPRVKVSVSYERCEILTNLPMTCFLCGEKVKPMVKHECSRPTPEIPR